MEREILNVMNNDARYNPRRGSLQLGKLKRVCYIPPSCRFLLNQSLAIETDDSIVYLVLEPPLHDDTKVYVHRLAKSQKPHRRYSSTWINIDEIRWIYLP